MKLERSKRLPSRFFAEGLSFVDGRLLLLTWRSKVILELNPDTLETLRFYPIKTEGWGITSHDGVIWQRRQSSALVRKSRGALEAD